MTEFLRSYFEESPSDLREWNEGVLTCSDALAFLTNLRTDIADIVFLDPPFNLGKEYGARGKKADLLSEQDYARFMLDVLAASVSVLRPGGALYLYHLPQW